jgi:hypothetical protein
MRRLHGTGYIRRLSCALVGVCLALTPLLPAYPAEPSRCPKQKQHWDYSTTTMDYTVNLRLGCLTRRWRKAVSVIGWIIRKDSSGEDLVSEGKLCWVRSSRQCSMQLKYPHPEIERATYTFVLRYWSQSKWGKFLKDSRTKVSCTSAKLASTCALP